MCQITFEDVEIYYPVRENRGFTLKDLLCTYVLRRQRRAIITTIHAVKKVSLHIEEGERVGIIGHNGAGKSTLLRAMAGVYPIQGGLRTVTGAICAIFDINLGFEYAASGWENIRFRGYLQGETPRSIDAKMQEIAEFSELGEFLNLPLNCYSAGMIMRLAFAIATSGNPEILLVDEVFATGDLRFQEKAKRRMTELMRRARAVVMVGHGLEFLQTVCTRVLWMEQGRLRAEGPPREIIAAYSEQMKQAARAA
jgi:ABC-type polysaccharide/polyol phosphate transport system ATPase subunit